MSIDIKKYLDDTIIHYEAKLCIDKNNLCDYGIYEDCGYSYKEEYIITKSNLSLLKQIKMDLFNDEL